MRAGGLQVSVLCARSRDWRDKSRSREKRRREQGSFMYAFALTQTWVAAAVFMYRACLCTLQGRGSAAALLSQCRKDASVFVCFAFRFGADCRILLTDLAGSLKMYIKNKLLRYSVPSSGNASPEEIGIAESERSLKSPLKNKLSAHLLYLFPPPQNLPRQPRDADGSGDKLK